MDHSADSPAKTKENLIETILNKYPEQFDSLLRNNHRYRIQIIYTQIDRLRNNRPVFTEHRFNVDPDLYFYPASTVKMPVALLALQRLNELKIPGLTRATTMINEALEPPLTGAFNDPGSEDGRPTMAAYIKKIFLVSDNDAYNRLYEFLGQEYINQQLQAMGYDSVQIVHRLEVSMNEAQHRLTNPVRFYNGSSKLIYEKPLQNSTLEYQPRSTFLGKGFYRGGQLVEGPFDFSKKNRILLTDLNSILKSVLFPQEVKPEQRFLLTEEDYKFLYRYMSMKPAESKFPHYDSTYSDAYVKFLMFGGKGSMPDSSLRIFNKVGDAYGFLTDVAYVVDHKRGVEFLLAATIHCNEDGIYNDGQYEYEQTGFPFMQNLGQAIYQYELTRERKIKPDLSRFRLDYRQ